jgi:hypothetical protein
MWVKDHKSLWMWIGFPGTKIFDVNYGHFIDFSNFLRIGAVSDIPLVVASIVQVILYVLFLDLIVGNVGRTSIKH